MTAILWILLGGGLLWWLFLTPAPPPKPFRRRLGAVGLAVRSLATCTDGVKLTVDAESGMHICAFEKRPYLSGVEQDIVMLIPREHWSSELADRMRTNIPAANFAGGAGSVTRETGADDPYVRLALFGRPEDLGFSALAALRAVAAAMGLPDGTIYAFQQHGHRDFRLERRLRAELQRNTAARKKTQELGDLWESAAA